MASTRSLEDRLANAAKDLDHVRGAGTDGAIRSPFARARANLLTWAGRGAGRSGFTGSRSGSHSDLSDRVADAVDAGTSLTDDDHARALAELDKQVIRVEHAIVELLRMVNAQTTTKPTAARVTSLQECRLCAAVGRHNAVLALGLCDWCWRLAKRLTPDPTDDQPNPELVLPHTDLVRMHNDGRRVTINLIAQYHPIPTEYDRIRSG